MTFTPFAAGQRVTAGELNSNSMQLIASTTLSGAAASVVFAVPAGYSRLQGFYTGQGTAAAAAVSARIQFNSDTGTNYNFIYTQSNNGTTSTTDNTGQIAILVGTLTGATSTANFAGTGNFTVSNTGGGTFFPVVVGTATTFVTTTNMYNGVYSGNWVSTAAITTVTFLLNTGNWATNSQFSLFGVA